MNILNPTISHNHIEKEESDLIMNYFEAYGRQWSKIGRELSYLNKTDAQIKREVCTRIKFATRIRNQKAKTEQIIERKTIEKHIKVSKNNIKKMNGSIFKKVNNSSYPTSYRTPQV